MTAAEDVPIPQTSITEPPPPSWAVVVTGFVTAELAQMAGDKLGAMLTPGGFAVSVHHIVNVVPAGDAS